MTEQHEVEVTQASAWNDWWLEVENYSTRGERCIDLLGLAGMEWCKAAFEAGEASTAALRAELVEQAKIIGRGTEQILSLQARVAELEGLLGECRHSDWAYNIPQPIIAKIDAQLTEGKERG